jgi:carnitine 3-dehydrogenase
MTIRTIALVGGGVIGAGWAARFLLSGYDVAVFDPDPDLARKLDTVTGNARRAYARLHPFVHLREGLLRLAPSVAEAVAEADFVQENVPENEDLKRRVLAEIAMVAPADTVVASSTSGLRPSRLQTGMAHPERLVVGHPFNPVYLLPLVEICGGVATSAAAIETATGLYRDVGMQPLLVRKEVDGFIADRLLEALWREALWLVNDGIATTAEIDDAVRYGAGLRWAFMGTFLTYRLAGGEAGMRHFLEQFGPALKLPWTHQEAPELTDALIDRLARQSDDQAAGASIRDLERLRDDCLVAVLSALRGRDYAAGATLRRFDEALYARNKPVTVPGHPDAAKPLRLHETQVHPDWIDYNGHMTEGRYLHVFGDASDALFRHVGIDADYHAGGRSYYTVETHVMNLREIGADEPLHVETLVLAVDDKRLHLVHSLYASAGEVLLATGEQMLLHVDTKAGRASPADPVIRARLEAIAAAHAVLPRPAGIGRHVGAPRR